MTLHDRLIHTVTEYDRKQSTGRYMDCSLRMNGVGIALPAIVSCRCLMEPFAYTLIRDNTADPFQYRIPFKR